MQHRRLRGLIALCGVAVVVAGCTAPGDNDSRDSTVSALAEQQLAANGVPDDVKAILERIKSTGEVDFADYEEAAQLWVSCVEPLGISATLVATKAYGLDLLSTSEQFPVGLEVGDPAEVALRDGSQRCRNQWWAPVETVYLNSPRSVEVLEASISPYRDQLLACLSEVGKPLGAHATRDEIMQTAADATIAGGRDCIEEAGYDGS